MINLPNTKFGAKQKVVIAGLSFNVLFESMEIIFHVQLMDTAGKKLEDKSINQDRVVIYSLNNERKVDLNFDIIETGGRGEYEYFFELMQKNPLPGLILQLAEKLKIRGIFE